MSIETTAGEEVPAENSGGEFPNGTPQFACAVCAGSVDHGDGHFLAAFPTDDGLALSMAARDGLLALCGACADEVAKVTGAWNESQPPAVAMASSIAEAYHETVDDCSFCGDGIDDGPVLGIDAWSAESDGDGEGEAVESDDPTHYALCDTCVPVFAEFLTAIAPE